MTHCITQPADLFRILDDPTFQISAIRICSEDVMEIMTTTAEEEYERSFKTNVFVAAFTTSLARPKLYEALDFLGDRCLYYDRLGHLQNQTGSRKVAVGAIPWAVHRRAWWIFDRGILQWWREKLWLSHQERQGRV